MTLTPADLARILAQPGYSLVEESCNPLATSTQRQALATSRVQNDLDHGGEAKAQSRALLSGLGAWRNEWEFQAAVIAEAKIRAITQTEYAMLVAIPNGQYRKGQRPEAGITAGCPDLVLLCPRGNHGALFLELKVTPNKCSHAQLAMHHRLRMEGYRVVVVWDSVDEVMSVTEEYLKCSP